MALHGEERAREVSLEAVLAEIGKGKAPACYLLCGDEEYRLQDALAKLVAALIPEAADRDLNLFTIDGEQEDPDSLCEMLATAPLLAGRKVVVVRNTRLFQSRNLLAPLITRIKEHLEKEPARAAADFRRFLQITGLALEDLRDSGWKRIDDDQWRQLVPEGGEERETWLPRVLELCAGQEPAPVKGPGEATDRLEQVLGSGMPEGNHLILTTEAADRRKRLYKTIATVGRILTFSRGKEAARQQTLQEMAAERLSQSGKRLSGGAWTVLGQKTGFDLRESLGAIEKLITYCGERSQIEAADVEAVVGRTKEDSVFALTGALALRNLGQALASLGELLGQGLPSLMILTMISREVRFLLQARLLIDSGRLKGHQANMDYGRFQKQILPSVKAPVAPGEEPPPIASQHPFVIYQALKNAERFSQEELRSFLPLLLATDLALKSTGRDHRLLLERLIVALCGDRPARSPKPLYPGRSG